LREAEQAGTGAASVWRQQQVPFPALPQVLVANINQESKDKHALIAFLDGCSRQRATITEVVYCANTWDIAGVIKLQHHGLVMTVRGQGYLCLDFGRHGLTWMLCDVFPGSPEGTFLMRGFEGQFDPAVVRDFCAKTKPFRWVGNNCESWSKGLLKEMEIELASGRDMLEDDEDDEFADSFIEHEDDTIKRGNLTHHMTRIVRCA